MKTLKDLTPEIRVKIPLYKERCTKDLYSGKEYADWKEEYTVKYIEYLYGLLQDPSKPIVIIANNPTEYREYFNLLFNEKINKKYVPLVNDLWAVKNLDSDKTKFQEMLTEIKNTLEKDRTNKKVSSTLKESAKYHWLFLTAEYSRVYLTWYKFIKDEFKIETKVAKELDWLYENVNKANIAKCFLCEKIVLVLRMPKRIIRNEVGFHDVSIEGAIQYDNQRLYYINGRKMPDWIFTKYFDKTLTFKDFIKETNEDVKAGIITIIKENEGNEGLLKFLNAELVDEQTLVHDSGHTEVVKLYKTKEKYSFLRDHEGRSNVPYAWFYEKCPSTGAEYLIDSSSALDNAIDAAKFHRPRHIPVEVPYNFSQFNN